MKAAKVTFFNPEVEEATIELSFFYMSTGGKISENHPS